MNLHLLRATPDVADALQMGLRHRQEDLLDLEARVDFLNEAFVDSEALIDCAEDLRRALRTHAAEQLSEIQSGLWQGRLLLRRSAGPITDLRKSGEHRTALSIDEASKTQISLNLAGEALRPLAQALASEVDARRFRDGIDSASGELEKARRAVFRLTEELPRLVSELNEIAEPTPARGANSGRSAPPLGLIHDRSGVTPRPSKGRYSPDPGA